jgi:MoaA/NifB/PqqE/SkfB family radical SAM enzyme
MPSLGKIKAYYSNHCIMSLGKKTAQLLWKNLSTPKEFKYLPKRLHIETTGCCNLDCEYCVLKQTLKNNTIMEFSLFKQLGPYFKYANRVMLSGMAEPLMNKNIGNYIRYIKEQNSNCAVSIITNATLLTESFCTELIEAKLDSLGFSIDSPEPEVNDYIRKRSNLHAMLDNLRVLNETKRRKASAFPNLYAVAVLQKKNFRHLTGIVKTVAQLGAKELYVNGLEPYTEALLNDCLWYPPNLPDDLADVLEESAKLAEKRGILMKLTEFEAVHPSCAVPNTPYILPNGSVTACAVLAYERDRYFKIGENNEILKEHGINKQRFFGNVFEQNLRDIWLKEEYVSFRDNVMNKRFPEECKSCINKHQIICPSGDAQPKTIIGRVRKSMLV